jgi:7-cyano-7-deazaguanine synthase
MIKKAVCLISGGLDSAVSAYIAKNEGYNIYGLTLNYGQRHSREIESAKEIVKSLKAKKHILLDLELSKFKGSSLTDSNINIEINKKIKDIGKKIPSTYVPARNTIFLSIALAFAESINSNSIFIGATSTDYSGYPDCRPEFFDAFQKMADIATKKSIEGERIQIKTPLLYLSKKDIILKGTELNVPFEKTWSCYKGHKFACGKCDSCLLRLRGFKEANIVDPIKYEKKSKL